ncbi:TerB family tellurite resistance protein [Mesorhizobium sp. CAU 1741]|uniref:tellurite resistance TerB family protein n=1 Tax=Mesorhizobium sp. CAU 1741 TaxID=3140366 RepID=UPI00325C282F
MAFELFSRITELFEGDPAVRRVAEDPALSAEILLLFRMVLADGAVEQAELDTLKRICADAFGIGEESFSKVMRYLQDYGYETDTAQALSTFRGYPRERRVELARHLAEIAKADRQLNEREVRLLARTLEVLQLDPNELAIGLPTV